MEKPGPIDQKKTDQEAPKTAEEARAHAEAAQRVPGTENFRSQGGLVGQEAIKKDSVIGNDNLEHETVVEKEVKRDENIPGGSFDSPK